MPTFYDIAENARRSNRSNLRPGADINYQYGAFGANAQSSAPAGWQGQNSFIPGDYYVPPGLQQDPQFNPYENEDANQFWYEEADPTKKYTSRAAALEVTGGDPDMERKVAMLNYQEAQKKQQQRQAIAMKILQEQRMREKNRLQAVSAQASRQAQQARYDQTTRRAEEDEASRRSNAAIWKSGIADPQNKESYLRQYNGTPEELNAFSLSMDNAAQGRVGDQERRNTPIFRSALSQINRGDHTSLGRYNLKEGDFLPYQVAQMKGEADARDRLEDNNFNIGESNITTLVSAEAALLNELKRTQNDDDEDSPELYQYRAKAQEKWDDNNAGWTEQQKWEFRTNINNYNNKAQRQGGLNEKLKSFNQAVDGTLINGVYRTVQKDPRTGEWINLWEEGRIDPKTRKVADGGQRFRGNVFSSGSGSGSVSGSEASRAQAQWEAQREAYIESQRQRAIDKQANIEDIQASSEAHRRSREAYKESIMTDEDRVARYQEGEAERQRVAEYTFGVEARAKADELSQAKFRLDNPDHPATQRVYQADPSLQMDDMELIGEGLPPDPNDPLADGVAGEGDPNDPFYQPPVGLTGSTNMPPAVVAGSRTNTLPAVVTGVATNTVAAPAQQADTSGLTEVNKDQWTALLNNKHQALITQWLEVHPNEPINELSLRHQAANELRKQGYKLN